MRSNFPAIYNWEAFVWNLFGEGRHSIQLRSIRIDCRVDDLGLLCGTTVPLARSLQRRLQISTDRSQVEIPNVSLNHDILRPDSRRPARRGCQLTRHAVWKCTREFR